MENIIYERDYSQEVMDFRKKTYTQSTADAWDFVVNKGIMKSIGERFRELPHIIIPQNKLLFEECEKKLDRFAFLHAGKIRSVVSYENFDAHIYVELPFFEFHGEDLELLRFLTNSMDMVHFYTTDSGGIRLSVSLEYFYDAGDKDAIIAEEVSKHPELSDMMCKKEDEEKEIVLNDPQLRAIIEKLAEGTGLSPEEYYDQFDAMLKEHPEIFDELLTKGLDEQRKKLMDNGPLE